MQDKQDTAAEAQKPDADTQKIHEATQEKMEKSAETKTGQKLHKFGISSDRKKDIRNILIILIPVMIFYIFTISQFKQLPGPLYGGDIYWHYGEALNIYNGAAPWENAQVSGEYAYFGWLPQFLMAMLAKLTGIGLMAVYLYFPLIILPFAAVVSFYLGMEIFKKRSLASMLCLMWVGMTFFFMSPNRPLDAQLLMPLFILFLARFIKTDSMKYALLTGLTAGIGALAYVVMLPAILTILFVTFVYSILRNHLRVNFAENMKIKCSLQDKSGVVSSIRKSLKLFIPMLAVCIAISMLFYFPFITYGAQGGLQNPTNEYTRTDMSQHGFGTALSMIASTFFSIESLIAGNIFSFIISVTSLFGLYFAVKKRNYMLIILFIAIIIGGLHYLITLPIAGISIIPTDIYGKIATILSPLLFLFSIDVISAKIPKYRNHIAAAVVIFLVFASGSAAAAIYNEKWVEIGRESPNPALADIANWINENTDKNAVFLAHEELAFAINGMTSRKVMISRRTHFSHFLDINQRIADAAVILYGNNITKSFELLKKYNVSYIYIDANGAYFAQNEPSLVPPSFESYLSQYNVSFTRVNAPLDPAARDTYRRYNLLAITPVGTQTQPWTNELHSRLTLVKDFVINGQLFARIYAVNYASGV